MAEKEVGPIAAAVSHLISFGIIFAIVGGLLYLMMELGRYLLGIKPKTNLFGTKKKRRK